jgi:NADH:ubiquinone oxidoreductase subunit F (NADH-binding)
MAATPSVLVLSALIGPTMTVDHAGCRPTAAPAGADGSVGTVAGGGPPAVTSLGGTLSARLMAAAAPDLADHDARCGPIPWRGPGGGLVRDLHDAGLTGRGGAAFPTWRKLAAAAEAVAGGSGAARGAGRRPTRDAGRSPTRVAGRGSSWADVPSWDGARRSGGPPVVVANAAEGEPESAKDAVLLAAAPHLVLDGVQLAAEAVGAVGAYVLVRPGPAADAVRRALAQRHVAGRDLCPTQVHEAPAAFLGWEASAVAAAPEGAATRPRTRCREPLAEAGVLGRPTLIQNVETLAHLAMIARWGVGWFRSVGTAEEPGTFLVTVTGAVHAPVVVEVPGGVTLGELIGLAGGANEPVGALRIGGYGGTWLPVGPESLAARGAVPGPGIVTVLPARACGLAETARIVAHLAAQNAGHCGPCVTGLPQLARAVAGMAAVAGRDPAPDGEDPAQAASRALRLAALVAGRGACHRPDGAARLVHSALRTFAADIRAHAEGYCRGSAVAGGAPNRSRRC